MTAPEGLGTGAPADEQGEGRAATLGGTSAGCIGAQVRAVAPLRISFAGGGTDVPPYPASHGGAVLSATIRRAATADVCVRADGTYKVSSRDLATSADLAKDELVFDGHLDLVKAVLRDLDPEQGLDVTLQTDAPPGSGLGSSSALVVAMLAAVGAVTGEESSPAELARRAYRVERVDLKIEGGMQDQYAAAFGGLNFITFGGDDEVEVRPVDAPAGLVEALERSLLLAWSGRGRTDDGILRRQVDGVIGGSARSLDALAAMKALALAMRDALEAGDLGTFGEGLREGWDLKRRLASGISTPHLDELHATGMAAGAAGGKVLGAGGGGYLVFLCPGNTLELVSTALEAAGAPCTRVAFDPRGVRIATPDRSG